MKIQLGSKKVIAKNDSGESKDHRITAKSDGGLSLYIDRDSPCSYPVFSLEVTLCHAVFDNQAKRKKHKSLRSEIVHQKHAAQIYAEMLGQVCHRKLYSLNLSGYQEVMSSFNLH